MKTMFKDLKKPAALMLLVVMLLSLQLTVFAADFDVSVSFYDDTTSTTLGIQAVGLGGTVPKPYLPPDYTDPLGGAPSVYDAIIAAIDQQSWTTEVGWDANPSYGDPGGYISSISIPGDGSYPTINNYTYDPDTGLHIAEGYGWVCTVIPDEGSPYDPYQYLTLEALEDGMDIEFRYQHYYYEWKD